jgi:iron complex transport system substrate-binding protein
MDGTYGRPSGRRRPAASRLVAALVVLGLSACGGRAATRGASPSQTLHGSAGAPFPITLTDDDGARVTIPSPPKRIITFAPSNTEIVFALGLGDELVGVSGKFDDYPPQARAIAEVGGAGEFGDQPNVEKVVALRPDLMLTISGGEQWKERLRELGIAVFTVNATDFGDLLNDIRTVGRVTGVPERAATLTAQMAARATAVQAAVAKDLRVSCFFEAYYPPLTTVGPHTFIFDLLQRAGCDPVSAGAKSDYPEWSVDELVADGPAVYLVASESGVSPGAVAKRPGFGAIAAVHEGRVYLIDSDLVSRPGPRVVDGLEALARVLHPGSVP